MRGRARARANELARSGGLTAFGKAAASASQTCIHRAKDRRTDRRIQTISRRTEGDQASYKSVTVSTHRVGHQIQEYRVSERSRSAGSDCFSRRVGLQKSEKGKNF